MVLGPLAGSLNAEEFQRPNLENSVQNISIIDYEH